MTGPAQILYLDTALEVGGSVISLYDLLRGLEANRYAPIVVTYTNHAYVERFRAVGAEVIVWDASGHHDPHDYRPQWVGVARDWRATRWLRTTQWGSKLYHGVGLGLLVARRIWPNAKALGRIIRERNVRLVHTNIRVGHDREGIIAARLTGVPCVCHVRHFERLGYFDRKLADSIARFIYISKAVQQSHLDSGVHRQKGMVVYNGLDIRAFETQAAAGAAAGARARSSFGLPPDAPTVGIVGRLDTWKGHEVFLRAMARVTKELPGSRGLIVGDPPPGKPECRDTLLALSSELTLSHNVVFSAFRMDVPTIMAALDVLVLASTSPEPFGRVLIEAMASGKPVIASDAGAAREIIEHGVQGLLVPAGDAEALAHAIAHLLNHRDAAALMGQRGMARARERFGMQAYVDGVQAIYREVLKA